MKSIKATLILSLSINIIFILCIIIGLVGIVLQNNTLEQSYELVEQKAFSASKEVQQSLDMAMSNSRALAYAFEGLKQNRQIDRDAINSMLKNVLQKNGDFFGIWTIWEPDALDGKDSMYANTDGYDGTGRFIPYWYWQDGNMAAAPCEHYDVPGDGDYYLLARDSGEETVLEPFEYIVDGKEVLMTSIVVPIKINDEVIGAVGIDLALEDLKAIGDEIKLMENGYGMILSNTGTYVTHPDSDKVGTHISDSGIEDKGAILEAIQKGNSIAVSTWNHAAGENEYIISIPIQIGYSKANWAVLVAVSVDEIMSKVSKIIFSLAIIALIGYVILIFVIWVIAGRISNPIKVLAELINRLAKYDLAFDEKSKAVQYLKRKDEVGLITNSVTAMQRNFIDLIQNISHTSELVASSSEELTATSQQSSIAANEVAKTIEEISKGANDQAKDTEKASFSITELSKLIEENQKKMMELNASVDQVTQLKEEGIKNIQELVEKNEMNDKIAEEINNVIVNANESAVKISEASQMIQSIADQTNLLALNAAIEAARAGEAGKGFAVVAEEIRKLAEQSDQFTREISDVINELKHKTENAVTTMEQMSSVVSAQTGSVKATEAKFKGIAHAIEKTKSEIGMLSASGKEMENKKTEIISVIENLSAISEENAAGTEEASASVEEQTASMEQIADTSEALAQLAEEMNQGIAKFKY